ncbi:MAG: MarR family winged helix-turn-helix transcriptional regulator [Candidatus Bathyarchaeota archaeon]|nr:MarR family winged helix-turn-helix transcriptional regulator [Candidatus Bathyarchaeota archaeon]
MTKISIEELAKHRTDVGWEILNLLDLKERLTLNELKGEVRISQEKLYKEIARLEGALLIEAKQDPLDNRRMPYSLTDYGKKILVHKPLN